MSTHPHEPYCDTCDNPQGDVIQPLGAFDANSVWMCARCRTEQSDGIAEDLARLSNE